MYQLQDFAYIYANARQENGCKTWL